MCGNGIRESEEQCDDGNTWPGDGCSPDCRIEECGNGVVDYYEQCDDGNTVSDDGCHADCSLEVCGNGRVEAGEQCDLGDLNGVLNGCLSNCTIVCYDCGGSINRLRFRFIGTETSEVLVYLQFRVAIDPRYFNPVLEPGQEFDVMPEEGHQGFDGPIHFNVNGAALTTTLSTDCSAAAQPGTVIEGLFEVVTTFSDMGRVC